jgi:hypothetical protein
MKDDLWVVDMTLGDDSLGLCTLHINVSDSEWF